MSFKSFKVLVGITHGISGQQQECLEATLETQADVQALKFANSDLLQEMNSGKTPESVEMQGTDAVRLYWDHRRINAIGQIQAAKRGKDQLKLEIALADKTPEEIAALKSLAHALAHGDNLAGRVSFAEAAEAYKLAEEDVHSQESKVEEAAAAAKNAESLGLR